MEVTIKGQTFEFISDFDPVKIEENVHRNWKVSAGDYFKFPVKIGNTLCFIKRFNKSESEISGYEFLVKTKGLKLQGLPIIYDIVHVTEAKKNVIYLFTEFMQGDTIDNLQRAGFSLSPIKLAGDLFFALKSIHDNNYWFPDFDPKNFFKTSSGDYCIIDLDSTYPVSVLPSNSMFGSKDYWGPVFEYYRKHCGFEKEEIKTIRGNVLNNVSLIYFLALYSYYLDDVGEDLTAHSIARLNDYLPSKHKLFSSTLNYCFNKNPLTKVINQRPLTFEVFRNLIFTALFPNDMVRLVSNSPINPEILLLTMNGQNTKCIEINQGQSFVLEWSIKNATSVKLLPKNMPVEPSGKITLSPACDTKYTIEAIHTHKKATPKISKSVEVSIYDPDLLRPTVNFFVDNGKNLTCYMENSNVRIAWTTKNAEKVLLDNTEVVKNGSKDLIAIKNSTHTLKAINSKNGNSKVTESTIKIITEKKPDISFTVSSKKIKSGETVLLNWKVSNGKNIFIMKDGDVLVEDCPNEASLNVPLELKRIDPSPKIFKFNCNAYTNSGEWITSCDQDLEVIVEKKKKSYGWIIWILLAILATLLIIYLVNKGNQSTVSTAILPTTLASVYSDHPSTASADTIAAVFDLIPNSLLNPQNAMSNVFD